MASPAELWDAAKTAVVGHLHYEGWTVRDLETGSAGPVDILASKDGVTIMVRIKTSLLPQMPEALTRSEIHHMRLAADQILASPFAALVQLDPPNAPSIRYLAIGPAG